MVSRFLAFTIAVVWIALGAAVAIVALSLTSQGLGDDGVIAAAIGAFRDGLTWWLVLVAGCLVVAALWIGLAHRNANSTAGLAAQGALIAMTTAMIALLLLLIASRVLGIEEL
jgi:hypothetical protein